MPADIPTPKINFQQPIPLLLQSLRPFSPELNEDICFVSSSPLKSKVTTDSNDLVYKQRLSPYFKRVHIERGSKLWENGDESDSLYVIESGMLRASYLFLDHSHAVSESMVAGTLAGEFSFLSRTKRNADVVAERDSVLWRLDVDSHDAMGKKEGWKFCRLFEQSLMRIAIEEQEGETILGLILFCGVKLTKLSLPLSPVLMGHLISSL